MQTVGSKGGLAKRDFAPWADGTASPLLRIEGLTKRQGVAVLTSAATRTQAADAFNWTSGQLEEVKGKADRVETFVPSRKLAG